VLYEDKSSRLYKAFIDSALATDLMISCNETHDASLFEVFMTLAGGTTHEKAEKLLLKEYAHLIEKGVTVQELKSAKQAVRVGASRRHDGPYAVLSALNEDLAVGDWARFATLPEAIQNVSVKDIQRVARTYLVDSQATIGWFTPKQ
jgi:zinc protease